MVILVRSWPLQFCSMVLSGLLMGAREFALYGLATILAQASLAGIWFFGGVKDLQLAGLYCTHLHTIFTLSHHSAPPILLGCCPLGPSCFFLGGNWATFNLSLCRHLLGWATFTSNLVLCISLGLCLAFHKPLRRKMGLMLDTEMTQALEPRAANSSTSKDVLKDRVGMLE